MFPYIVGSICAMIGLIISILLYSALTQMIDCDGLSNQEVIDSCEGSLASVWLIVGLIPVASFFVGFNMVGGFGATLRVMSISNIEERAKKMERLGVKHILKKTKAKLIDESKRGNKIYAIEKLVPNYTLKYLVYDDPSSPEKTYGCFVPSNLNTADEAMAWKFFITEEEYQEDLVFEA